MLVPTGRLWKVTCIKGRRCVKRDVNKKIVISVSYSSFSIFLFVFFSLFSWRSNWPRIQLEIKIHQSQLTSCQIFNLKLHLLADVVSGYLYYLLTHAGLGGIIMALLHCFQQMWQIYLYNAGIGVTSEGWELWLGDKSHCIKC